MDIRLGRLEDVDAVMALIRRVVPLMQAAGNWQWDDAYPNPEVFGRDVERYQLWLAEEDGRLAGVAAITQDQEPEYRDVGWDPADPAVVVHRLAVDPDFRGRGVAKALMAQSEIVALSLGITHLRLDTNTENQAMQRLFLQLGYACAGEIGLAVRPGRRFRCFGKRLADPAP
jgi:ribosomal protein S18 acetylase RimI-like enzyme